jgi:hypothetical protein
MAHPFLSDAAVDDLRCLAAMIVPASARFGIPAADDPAIFKDLLGSLDHDRIEVEAGLAHVRAKAGRPLAELDAAERAALGRALQAEGEANVAVLSRLVMLAYYRDDRVVRSLGLEPRAPFPKGHEVEVGDWSLLDPVRARRPMWRDPR